MTISTRTRRLPVRPLPAIVFLAQPGARLLLINDIAHIVAGEAHKRINGPTVDAMLELGYIESPRQLDPGILIYTITTEGIRVAEEIENLKRDYHQLPIPQFAQNQPPTKERLAQIEEPESQPTQEEQTTPANSVEQAATESTTAPIEQAAAPVKKRRLTPEEARAERTRKRAEIKQSIQSGMKALCAEIQVGKSKRLLDYLAFASKFHKYSVNNQLLILLQRPDATRVAGYNDWQRKGYQVRRGEKGIAILAPRPYSKKKTSEEGEEIVIQGVSFGLAYVYDVSQLEQNPDKPIPQFFTPLADDQEQLYQIIAAAVRADDIVLEIGETGTAQGYSAGKRIRLREGLDSTNRVLTLIHEWAHEQLHQHSNGRTMPTAKKECHAEVISYIVAHHFGIHNPFSSDYLQSWGNTEQEIQAELQIVSTTAGAMIRRIEEFAEKPITAEQPAAPAPVQEACNYCERPAASGQEMNGIFVCAACIAQETAILHPDDIELPTDEEPEPEPPTPTPAPTSTQQEAPGQQESHPLLSKPEGYQCSARIGKSSTIETIRIRGHYCNNTIHLDRWTDETPMFSTILPYSAIEVVEQPAQEEEPERQPPTPHPLMDKPEGYQCSARINDGEVITLRIKAHYENGTLRVNYWTPDSSISSLILPYEDIEVIAGEEELRSNTHKHNLKMQNKRICFDWASRHMYVSLEGYEKIQALVREYGVCGKCERYYSEERPQVAGTWCLACLLSDHSGKQLSFIGSAEPDQDGDPHYLFTDTLGIIHVTEAAPGAQERAEPSVTETLRYWQFPIPEQAAKNGRMIDLRTGRRSIIGDVRREVIILHCWDTYPEEVDAHFVLSKSGQCMQLNRRKPSHRALFAEAKKRIEATMVDGTYHINGKERYYYNDYDEYAVIAQILENTAQWPL